jgi:hypothetical protein
VVGGASAHDAPRTLNAMVGVCVCVCGFESLVG